MKQQAPSRVIAGLGLFLGVCSLATLVSSPAQAASSAAGEEFLSNAEAAPPNILFVLDLSDEMLNDCGETPDVGDTGDTAGTLAGSSCLEYAIDSIEQLSQHYDWAYFGVVGTTDRHNDNYFVPIAPLGSTHSQISTALDNFASVSGIHAGGTTTTSWGASAQTGTTTRNLAEVLSTSWDYLQRTGSGSCPGYLSDSFVDASTDFCDAAITWACQETHIIVITADLPRDDKNASNKSSGSSLGTDIKCTYSAGITSGTDQDCLYDNTAHYMFNGDARSDLSGDQSVTVHTVGVKIDGASVAENLYGNAMNETGGEGVYTVADSGEEIISGVMTIMGYIRQGYYSRSAPVVSADGEYIIFSFYEITGDNPLAEGHVRAYTIDTDPTSTTYGAVEYDSSKTQFGGAVWDAGDLLVSRPVVASESNPDDRDGLGQRDIYTFVPEFMSHSSTSLYSEANTYHRMGFDLEFVDSVDTIMSGSDPSFLDHFLLTDDLDADGCPDNQAYNLDGYDTDCTVDTDDLQALVDFTRGLPTAEYRYLDETHGYWKLGDSPHSRPVVVQPRNNVYAIDPTYRNFLEDLVSDDVPEAVFVAANDGMLHAFRLKDDSTTSCSPTGSLSWDCNEEGEELWAWIPANTLYAEKDEEWSGNLIDMMWYGRTFLFDGSPVVEDVWIDGSDGSSPDGAKAMDGGEWKRVLVVQQGKGGPVTLALDITDTQHPKFLWEQTNDSDVAAMGYTVSTPVIANLYNNEDSADPKDTWVAMWGGGRQVPLGVTGDTEDYTEPNLYLWAIGDDYWGSSSVGLSEEGSNGHPEGSILSALDADLDGNDEFGYISGSVAAVDVDSDGDVDVVYFPVSSSYEPADMGDPDGDGLAGLNDMADPGYTWLYKAIIDTSDLDDPTWCEFYDPLDTVGERPEVYYAPTTSWHGDGSLGVYWGSGTPYDRDSTDYGYFFAVKDETPLTCASATAITDCGTGGAYTLNAGEGLTGDPVIYAGTVYFPTYEPASDRCSDGTGRIYGLDFEDCSGNVDTDGDGVADSDSLTVDGYPSSVAIGEHGIYYGTSEPTTNSSTVGEMNVTSDPYLSTRTMGLREVF
ncbi:MAG: hypothetical protein VX899_18920 [Myxococcota bacterium]|nr:hypothetical protein [Myxococcota bacterium]